MRDDFSSPVIDVLLVLRENGRSTHAILTLGNGDHGFVDYSTLEIAQFEAPVLMCWLEMFGELTEMQLAIVRAYLTPAQQKQVGGEVTLQ